MSSVFYQVIALTSTSHSKDPQQPVRQLVHMESVFPNVSSAFDALLDIQTVSLTEQALSVEYKISAFYTACSHMCLPTYIFLQP